MKLIKLKTLTKQGRNLFGKVVTEVQKIKELIFNSGVNEMLKKLFEAVEATFRAAIYLLILMMGLSLAGLGSYTILFLSIRMGQFLYELILKNKWL